MNLGIVVSHARMGQTMRRLIESLMPCKVAWTTAFADHAKELTAKNPVDLLLVDVRIVELDGPEALKRLSALVGVPVVVFVEDLDKQGLLAFEALAHGALDVATVADINLSESYKELTGKLKRLLALSSASKKPPSKLASAPKPPPLILIGASTGGPLAIASILAGLPKSTPAAIVIAQHVDEKFSKGLADWLQMRSKMPVALAESGERLLPAHVYLCRGDRHLLLNADGSLLYRANLQKETSYLPNIDAFFESFATHWSGKGLAILLTGMGSDGAQGLKLLREKGWNTIAEHQDSCVVYGMPKAAVSLGAAEEVLSVHQIPLSILTFLKTCEAVP